MTISEIKQELLTSYSTWFSQYSIGNKSSMVRNKEYLIHVHNFIRIIDYYEYWETKGYEDLLDITALQYTKALQEAVKGLQLSKITYYA